MKRLMKNPAFLTALALLACDAWALDFKTNLRTVQLPTSAQRRATPVARPTTPGKMTISGQMFCGDADVEHYVSDQGGNFDVVNGDTEVITYGSDGMSYNIDIESTQQPIYTMVGYWVVRDGQEPLPTPSNFNTVSWGYMSVTPDGNRTMDLTFPSSRAADGRDDALQMLRKEVTKTHALTSKSYGHSGDYRVFMGVFGCINPMKEDGSTSRPSVPSSLSESDYRPSNADLNYSFTQQPAMSVVAESSRSDRWSSQSSALSAVNSLTRVDIRKSPNHAVALVDTTSSFPVNFNVDNSGEAAFPSTITDKIRTIVQIPYPTFTEYENARTAATNATNALNNLRIQIDQADRDTRPGSTLARELADAIAAFEAAEDARDASAAANAGVASAETQSAYDAALATKTTKQSALDDRMAELNDLRSQETTAIATEQAARAEENTQRLRRPQVYADQVRPALDAVLPASIALATNKIDACRTFGLDVDATEKKYRWEHFPMNASCRAFFEGGTDLATLYNNFAAPPNHVEPNVFLSLKKELVQNLFLAGAYEATQAYLETSSSHRMTNHHCFKTNGNRAYIDKLIASYPILTNYDSANRRYIIDNTPAHLHPEPLYALRNGLSTYALQARETQVFVPDGGTTTYTYYDEATDDAVTYEVPSGSMQTIPAGPNPRANLNAVFCQIYGDGCRPSTQVEDWKRAGILMPVGNPARASQHLIDADTFAPAVNINFKIRGLSREGRACQGVVFC